MMLRKAGGNWVVGDRFFDREVELEALEERVLDGTHTLLNAQRRMGKTSLVRELLRRLKDGGEVETIFVDLEAASNPADAIAEIGVQAKPTQGAWSGIRAGFANLVDEAGGRIEELAIADIRVKLRAGIDAGNWQQKGDTVLAALAASDRPVVLAIDEMPLLVNRILKGDSNRITSEGKTAADGFLSWLRKGGQTYRGRVCMILSGSVGLEPLLQQAGLSAHANIFSPYDLKPWSEDTAVSCLTELARTYEVNLPPEIGQDMCRRLRCCIPHHVQMFFDRVHEHLRRARRIDALPEDVELTYRHEMLGVRGQVDLQHYENRLETVLGRAGYTIALELLTRTAVNGHLDGGAIEECCTEFLFGEEKGGGGILSVEEVLHVLRHDGYLEPYGNGYRFVSGLLEDWWRGRYGQNFVPVGQRHPNSRRARR